MPTRTVCAVDKARGPTADSTRREIKFSEEVNSPQLDKKQVLKSKNIPLWSATIQIRRHNAKTSKESSNGIPNPRKRGIAHGSPRKIRGVKRNSTASNCGESVLNLAIDAMICNACTTTVQAALVMRGN